MIKSLNDRATLSCASSGIPWQWSFFTSADFSPLMVVSWSDSDSLENLRLNVAIFIVAYLLVMKKRGRVVTPLASSLFPPF